MNLSASKIKESILTNDASKKNQNIKPKLINNTNSNNKLTESIIFDKIQSESVKQANINNSYSQSRRKSSLDISYIMSPVKGPSLNIYPIAPVELLEPNLAKLTNVNQKNLFIFYFESLYPLTKSSKKWRKMSIDKLQEYYDNLQFWYIFNNSWTSSPMPVTLSDKVYKNWGKNKFYQSNTIIESCITSWGLAYRNNNGPQDNVKSYLTFTTKSGKKKIINSVVTDKEYWEVACDNKIEVSSWGWNPYPFGIYSQGPLNGTGNFLYIPKKEIGGTIVGTSHWDIILQCKSEEYEDSSVWTSIFNHELHDSPSLRYQNSSASEFITRKIDNKIQNVTPWIIIHDIKSDTYKWSFLLGEKNGGYTPFLIAYFLWYLGGFGGIGGNEPFDKTWKDSGYKYTPVYVVRKDGQLAFPEDQSIPDSTGLFKRSSEEFWTGFNDFFKLIKSWDTNWEVEKWRHPVLDNGVASSVANPSDSLMQAYVTGNFEIVRYSLFNTNTPAEIGSDLGQINPKLSKFSKDPAIWSLCQKTDGTIDNYNKNQSGFPFGELLHQGSGYNFVIRTQMPNVNFDICCEFADFRITTSGNLSLGTGDQRLWSKLFTKYGEKYMFTADPDNINISHNFKDEYAIRLPNTELKTSNPNIDQWLISKNVATGTTFFNFDIKSGMWDAAPTLTGIKNEESVLVPKNLGVAPSINSSVYLYIAKNVICNNLISSNLKPPASNNIINITGGAVTDSDLTNDPNCNTLEPYQGYSVTNAPNKFQYFEDPVDDFTKGIVGYQANGSVAQLGSCQTRWMISSKGIPWDFSSPLSNRLLLLKGADLIGKEIKNTKIETLTLNIFLICFIFISVLIGVLYYLKKNTLRNKSKQILFIFLIITSLITLFLIAIKIVNDFNNKSSLSDNIINDEAHRLRTYFALVYPKAPVSRWNKMSLDELRTFFCSLHWWYKGEGLPSPEDYLNTKYWTNSVPFGKNSSWKTFCLRKNCVINVGIQAYNETDNKLVIGHNDIVPTDANDTPSAIIWTGRQLQSLGAQSQQTTFFSTPLITIILIPIIIFPLLTILA